MRKIIVSEFVSLDGMMSDPGDTMKWVTAIFNAKEGAYESDLYDRIGTLLLGRTTYDIWGAYWPKALSDPKSPKDEVEMAGKIDRAAKVVVTSRPVTFWGKQTTTQLSEINRSDILELKGQPGKDIGVISSATIVQQLTALGLVDEFHLLVHPLIMGKGKPAIQSRRGFCAIETRRHRGFREWRRAASISELAALNRWDHAYVEFRKSWLLLAGAATIAFSR